MVIAEQHNQGFAINIKILFFRHRSLQPAVSPVVFSNSES
jgi:hypothetical protein